MAEIPLDQQGTSDYPVNSELIGQKDVFEDLQEFFEIGDPHSVGNFILYGDWGSGKTRVGHQLIAETVAQDSAWKPDPQGNPRQVTENLDEMVLPLYVRLSEFEEELDRQNVAELAVLSATENLVDSEGQLYKDAADKLGEHGGDLWEIQDKVEDVGVSRSEKFENVYDELVSKTEIDRLLLIVDEVEEAGSVGSQAPESQQSGGAGRQTLEALFEGLKNAENEVAFPIATDFVLLCTSGVAIHSSPTGGVERRIVESSLSEPTIEEARAYIESVLQQSNYDHDIPKDCRDALFFASFNNFGWFTRVMASMMREIQQSPGKKWYEILSDERTRFDDLFDPEYIERILTERGDADVHEAVVEMLYRIKPTPIAELGISESKVDDITAYTPPLIEEQPIGRLVGVETTISDIYRELETAGFTEDTTNGGTASVSDQQLNLDRLDGIVKIFQIGSNPEKYALYHNRENLKAVAEYAFEEGNVDEVAVERLTDALEAVKNKGSDSEVYLGPTIEFFTRWNKLWRKRATPKRWLRNEDAWDEMTAAARSVGGNETERKLKGFINIRFNYHERSDSDHSPHSEGLQSTDFTAEIEGDNTLEPYNTDEAIVLAHENLKTTKQDLKTVRDSTDIDALPPIYIIFEDQNQAASTLPELEDSVQSLWPFIFPHVIPKQDIRHEFLIRFSFLHDEFTSGDIGQENKTFLDEQYRQPLSSADVSRLQDIDDEGWLLKRMRPDRVKVNDIAEGALRVANSKELTDDQNDEYNKVWAQKDVFSSFLLEAENADNIEIQIPNFIPRVLDLIGSDGPIKTSRLAGRLPAEDRHERTAEDILELLHAFDLLTNTDDGYILNNKPTLRDQYNTLSTKVPSSEDEAFDGFAVYPDSTTIANLFPTENLSDYSEEISTYEDRISDLEFETIVNTPATPDDWFETVNEIAEIVSFARKGYDPEHEYPGLSEIGPSNIGNHFSDVRSDEDFNQFSFHYRIEFLADIDETVDDTCSELLNALSKQRQSVENKYDSANGVEFPVDSVIDILDVIEQDLNREEDIQLPDILEVDADNTQGTAASIREHLDSWDFDEVVERMTWYQDMLEENEINGPDPLSDFRRAYDAFEDFLDEFNDLVDTWDDAKEYLKNHASYLSTLNSTDVPVVDDLSELPSVDELEDPNVDFDSIYDDAAEDADRTTSGSDLDSSLEDLAEEPEKQLTDKNPDEMYESIDNSTVMAKVLQRHAKLVKQAAELEFKKEKEALDREWEPLEKAASILTEEISLDYDKISDADGVKSKLNAINDLKSDIDDEGERIFKDEFGQNAHRYWDLYKEAYHATNTEEESVELNEEQLEKLQDAGLLTYQKQFAIEFR